MVGKLPDFGTKAIFVDVVVEGVTPTTSPTRDNLDTWINVSKIPFTTARDRDSAVGRARDVLGSKETTYIVDRATRRILVVTDIFTAIDELQKLP